MAASENAQMQELATLYGVDEIAISNAFGASWIGDRVGLAPDEHGDVLELERVSYLVASDQRGVEGIPVAPEELHGTYSLMKVIEHVRRCKPCAAMVVSFTALRPTSADLSTAVAIDRQM